MRALIFDLDGTLVDSLPGIEHSVDTVLAQHGLPVRQQELKSMIGPPIRNILSTVAGTSEPGLLSALEHSFRRHYDTEGWRKTVVFPGALAALERARAQGIRLFIATNKPARATSMILAETGLRSLFTDVVCRDSAQPPFASKQAMLERLLLSHDLDRATSLYVGDTTEDLEAGAAVGIETVIVNHGYGGPALAGHTGFVRLHHFQELPI